MFNPFHFPTSELKVHIFFQLTYYIQKAFFWVALENSRQMITVYQECFPLPWIQLSTKGFPVMNCIPCRKWRIWGSDVPKSRSLNSAEGGFLNSELCREAILLTTAPCVTEVMKTSHGSNLHLGGTHCCANTVSTASCVLIIPGAAQQSQEKNVVMVLIGLLWLFLVSFYVFLTQARVTGDEGTSIEKIHP